MTPRHASAPARTQAATVGACEAGQASGVIEYDADHNEYPKVATGAMILDVSSFGNLLEHSLEALLVTLFDAVFYQHWN